MSALAKEHDAINLSQGFPDFPLDPVLFDLVHKHMYEGKNQYAPMAGVPELRQAIARKAKHLYGVSYDWESEITVSAGGTQAIYAAIAATVHEGDEVVIFTPAYDCYEPAVLLQGGKPVFVQLKAPSFKIDWEEVSRVVSRKTRMIIINTPHNPTGSVFSHEDMQKLEVLTRDSDIIVLSDEVYEHVVFDGVKHRSVCEYPGLAERSFIVASFGKTFHVTGWKMGYCMGPSKLMGEFRKAHQFIVFAVNTPMQYALAEYLQHETAYSLVANFYQQKRDLFIGLLAGSRFTISPSKGTYFQLLDYSVITKESDTELAKRWTKELGVASIPVSVFYHKQTDHKVLRFCFAKQDETLERAAFILKSV